MTAIKASGKTIAPMLQKRPRRNGRTIASYGRQNNSRRRSKLLRFGLRRPSIADWQDSRTLIVGDGIKLRLS
jgi:hypothetical protein